MSELIGLGRLKRGRPERLKRDLRAIPEGRWRRMPGERE